MIFIDKAPISGVRRTENGYLVADAKVARTGIQVYSGAELGIPDRETIRVFRPEDEVFNRDALNTFAHRPVTLDHPSQPVTSVNWRDLAVGQTGGDVVRDGEYVRVPLVLMDADAISRVEGGTRELSMGYSANLELKDGTSPSGEAYDAVMTGMRMNHVAVVAKARGGSELKIGDTSQGDLSMNLRKVVVDGFSIDMTEQGEQAVKKLQQQVADAATNAAKMVTDHQSELAKRDVQLAAKDVEIADLKKKVLSDSDLDKLVADRSSLIATAKALAPNLDPIGKSSADIKRAVVAARLGDAAIAGKGDAYIDAAFDLVASQATQSDPVLQAMAQTTTATVGDTRRLSAADSAYEEMLKKQGEAWKQ